jgi:hypothetical protein
MSGVQLISAAPLNAEVRDLMKKGPHGPFSLFHG